MTTPIRTDRPLRAIIAGGGTGGHVFPAIAIALALKKKTTHARILFVGAKGRMEMQKVPKAGFHIIGLDIAGLQRRFSWQNFLLPWKIVKSLAGARQIVRRFKPDIVIGVGGYASGPVLWAAARLKIPIVIQEQNSFPGITNRMFGKKADKICVAYEGMDKFFPKQKLFLTGNPVRNDVVNTAGKKKKALKHFGMSSEYPVLFVTGGSLGARTINESVKTHINLLAKKNIQLIWQTGTAFYQEALASVPRKSRNFRAHISAFIDRMDYAYAAADLVVSRAGAIAVSEICTVGKPAILIPSPNVAEDHQTKNAMALVNHHAAVLIRDDEAQEKLGPEASRLIFDENKKQRLREKIAGMSYRNAAEVIAESVLEVISR